MLRLIPAILLLVLLSAAPAMAQRGEVYCNVTAITSEQLSNGIKVTIQADGELNWDLDFEQLTEQGGLRLVETEWGYNYEITERFRRLPFRIWNARSKLGTGFIPINKYPISHVEIYIPEWAHEGVGLEIDVVNYLGFLTGEGDLQRYRGNFDWNASEDSSAIMILWEADRFPPPEPPKTPEDLPEELSVTSDDGLLTLSAVNAKVQDITNAIAREAGFAVAAPADSDLRVSLWLRDVTPQKAIEAVATGCGLCATAYADGGWIVAEPTGTAGGYAASGSRRVYLRNLRAVDAVDLLPNFLLKYLHPDEEANAIVISGPECLLDRVAEDLAELDTPPPEVSLEAVAVEYTSAETLSRALHLERYVGDFAGALDSLTGGLRFLWLEGLPEGWYLLLDALEGDTTTELHSRVNMRVLNAHQARLFVGQARYVILERLIWGEFSAELEPISTGTELTVQPLIGEGDEVVLHVNLTVRTITGADPKSGLPIVAMRSADGVVRVRDGETIVLAGLEMTEADRRDSKVPVLGDLPLAGTLFRSPDRSRTQKQLAIFLTPHIIRTQVARKGDVNHG
jgi:type II secretory pathway component GspD/PulD (secretin)